MAAQVTVLTPIGSVTVTGSPTSSPADSCIASTRPSSERIGTTTSNGSWW